MMMTNCKFSLTMTKCYFKGAFNKMFEAIIYNISVTVAGIYLFHRLQYSENRIMIFSKAYVTVLMTIVALLLSAYPIPLFDAYIIELTFIPLLFIGRYTNLIYTVLAAIIVSLVSIFIFDHSIIKHVRLLPNYILAGHPSTNTTSSFIYNKNSAIKTREKLQSFSLPIDWELNYNFDQNFNPK